MNFIKFDSMRAPHIVLLLVSLYAFTTKEVYAQDYVFRSWIDYRKKKADTVNVLQKRIREIKEIIRYGGNDYEFKSNESHIDPKACFAIRHKDTVYVNGEKIKLDPFFCKVEYETEQKLFLYGTLKRNKKEQLEDAEGLFQAMGIEASKLERGLNEKRVLYMLDKKSKRATLTELSYEMVKSYLRRNKSLLKRYLKDDKRMLYNTMVWYIVQMDNSET